jgi:hypothetical protein
MYKISWLYSFSFVRVKVGESPTIRLVLSILEEGRGWAAGSESVCLSGSPSNPLLEACGKLHIHQIYSNLYSYLLMDRGLYQIFHSHTQSRKK